MTRSQVRILACPRRNTLRCRPDLADGGTGALASRFLLYPNHELSSLTAVGLDLKSAYLARSNSSRLGEYGCRTEMLIHCAWTLKSALLGHLSSRACGALLRLVIGVDGLWCSPYGFSDEIIIWRNLLTAYVSANMLTADSVASTPNDMIDFRR